MKIIKPLDLSFNHRSFAWRESCQLVSTVLLGFPLGRKHGAEPVSEQDMWQQLAPHLDKDQVLDMGMPKPVGEILIFGHYHAPEGRAVRADNVEFQLGELHKALRIVGNRYWGGLLGPSEPEPLKSLPLRYEYAFGGREYPKNPLGKGLDEVDVHGEMRLPLPNIEDPAHLITSSGQRPEPAGFAPLDPGWPQRRSRMGTYDDKWLRERAPAYADDLDWHYFNAAPRDQWLPEFLVGDENYALANMHPQQPILRGTLPGYRVRCFASHGGRFSEIDMRAETVAFFPDAELGIVIYRGSLAVADDQASEVDHVILGYEHLRHSPRSPGHYQHALHRRLDEQGFAALMDTSDLIAEGMTCPFKRLLQQTDKAPEDAMGQNIERKAETVEHQAKQAFEAQRQTLEKNLQAAGIDPAPYLEKIDHAAKARPQDPQLQKLGSLLKQALPMKDGKLDIAALDFGKLGQLDEKITELTRQQEARLRQQMQQTLTDLPESEGAEAAREKLEQALGELDQPAPLPRFSFARVSEELEQQGQVLQKQRDALRAQGVAEAQRLSLEMDIDTLCQDLHETERQLRQTYRMGAHLLEPGAPPHSEPLDIIRHRFYKRWEKGESLAGGDYACLDLSGCDLSGIDLSQAYLEQVDLRGANLRGARLEGAILVRAKLEGADLREACLREANLGASSLEGADLSGADLTRAILARCDLAHAHLQGCELHEADFREAHLAGADFSQARLPQALFVEQELQGVNFQQAHLPQSQFIECQLNQADFSQAELDQASWIDCDLSDACFQRARLDNGRFIAGCRLPRTDFRHAFLNRANLRETDLQEAAFCHASLDQADFSKACMRKADLSRASARRALFMASDLEQASLYSVNLMEASLMQARLVNTDLRYSNCYGVEFLQAQVGRTRFDGANLDASKLEHWHPSR